MSEFNLLSDAWIPITTFDGSIRHIRPAEIGFDIPATAIAWPRADFRIAQLEFLIGLLATCCPPKDAEAWQAWWDAPPDVATLDAALAPFIHAFSLDGPGPRFLQDFEQLEAGVESVEKLLIEAPGEQGLKKNTDLLVHRGQASVMSRATASIALYTLQSWAPAGGAGNRTGLRGGGPMLTLLLPDKLTLWHMLWANVPCGVSPTVNDLQRVFPWLAPTRISNAGVEVTPADAHASQVWWGMPRRVRLVYETPTAPTCCDITGSADISIVTGWKQRPYGVKYSAWSRSHPLTPTYRQKSTDPEWLPVHPQPGGIGFRHWLGLVIPTDDLLRRPAPIFETWSSEQRPLGRVRLLAAGFDMDNMKARSFVESEVPLPGAKDRGERLRLDKLARALVLGAEATASIVRSGVRAALFSAGASVNPQAELLNAAREKLWEVTEGPFHQALNAAAGSAAGDDPNPPHLDWLAILRRSAIAIFDELAPIAPDGSGRPERVTAARRNLLFGLAGYGASGAELYKALNIPPPQKAGPKIKRSKAA